MSLADTPDATEAPAIVQPLQTLGRERLLDRAVAAIKDYILANRLNGGDRLPSEMDLARSLAVSRNVVRQAISSLETLGVVRTVHGRGSYVADVASTSVFEQLASWINPQDLDERDFLETRAIFERGVFDLVMQRATDEDFVRMEEIACAMHAAATPEEAGRRHDDFHQTLLQATGNPFLMTLGTILYRFFWSVGYTSPHVHIVSTAYQQETHRDLVRLLRRRRPEDLPALVATHLGHLHGEKG